MTDTKPKLSFAEAMAKLQLEEQRLKTDAARSLAKKAALEYELAARRLARDELEEEKRIEFDRWLRGKE